MNSTPSNKNIKASNEINQERPTQESIESKQEEEKETHCQCSEKRIDYKSALNETINNDINAIENNPQKIIEIEKSIEDRFKKIHSTLNKTWKSKKDTRVIRFLYHYYGLHLNSKIKFHSHYLYNPEEVDLRNYYSGINMLNDSESIILDPETMKFKLEKLLFLIWRHISEIPTKQNKYKPHLYQEISIENDYQKVEIDISKITENDLSNRVEFIIQHSNLEFKKHCIDEEKFTTLNNSRAINYTLIVFLYLTRNNEWTKINNNTHRINIKNKNHQEFIRDTINKITIKASSQPRAEKLNIIKFIFDIIPMSLTQKISLIDDISFEIKKSSRDTKLIKWIDENNDIYQWTYKYIDKIILKSHYNYFVTNYLNWYETGYSNTIKSKIKNAITVINDIQESGIDDFNFSKDRLFKSAQKFRERTSSDVNTKIKITNENIILLKKAAEKFNMNPNSYLKKILTDEIEGSPSRWKHSMFRHRNKK